MFSIQTSMTMASCSGAEGIWNLLVWREQEKVLYWNHSLWSRAWNPDFLRLWNSFWDHSSGKNMDIQGKMDWIGCWISLFNCNCFKIGWIGLWMALMGIIDIKERYTSQGALLSMNVCWRSYYSRLVYTRTHISMKKHIGLYCLHKIRNCFVGSF